MAGTPLFGTTNGVTELDVGQVGSARRAAGTVSWVANTVRQAPQLTRVVHGAPGQNIVFEDNLGWRGEIVQWTGHIKFKDNTEFAAFVSLINQYLTGSGLDADTGVRSAVDLSFTKPTLLEDALGNAIGSRVVMIGQQFEGPPLACGTSGFLYLFRNFTLIFRVLG